MKDQIRLLRDCFHNEIPAVVFQGNDSCAGEILEAAKKIYLCTRQAILVHQQS